MIRLVGAVSPYILFAVAAVPFLAGSGLKRLLRRQLGGRVVSAALIVVLLAGGLFATQLPSHRFERTTASRSDALAAAAAIIGRGARTGDAVVFLPGRFRATARWAETVHPLSVAAPLRARGSVRPDFKLGCLLSHASARRAVDRIASTVADSSTLRRDESRRPAHV